MKRFVCILILAAVPLSAAPRRRAVRMPVYPPCAMVTGAWGMTFTRDDGRTLAPLAESPRRLTYTYGLATMIDEPETLVAWQNDDLLISTDAGCSWRVAATVPGADFPPRLAAARAGRVYAWSDNRSFLVRYDARGAVLLKQPVDFIGFAVDPNDADRLRAGGNDGTIWESRDAGETWTQIGRLASVLPYRFAFDPRDLDHVVAGVISTGAHVSRDGGLTWTRATGIAASANVFELAVSPVDSSRVWAMGLDLADSMRRIFVSSDGGASYAAAVDHAPPEVTLTNGPLMVPHPLQRDVLYFEFGTHIFAYGTDLFRYDHATRTLTKTHNAHDGINAIAFSRVDPAVMYLGLEAVDP